MTDQSPGSQDAARGLLLAERFVVLADTLVDDYDVVDLLDQLVTSCLDVLDVTAAGILLTDQRNSLQLMASSSEETRVLELFQLESDEGPCVEAVRSGAPVIVPDVRELRQSWPEFAVVAEAAGFLSVHAFPLRLRKETIGALNLFSTHAPPITVDEQRIAQALADVATIGILQQRSLHRAAILTEQLQSALNSRIVVEQAKGVLAEHAHIDVAEGFVLLRAYARGTRQKIGAVADDVVRRRLSPDEVIAGPH